MGGRIVREKKTKMLCLPVETLNEVDRMILETGLSQLPYWRIAGWLNESGYEISKSTVARHAKKILANRQVRKKIKGRIKTQRPLTVRMKRIYAILSELLDLIESEDNTLLGTNNTDTEIVRKRKLDPQQGAL